MWPAGKKHDMKLQSNGYVMHSDEIKRRKKELNSMRSEFSAYRWHARTEWANEKVIDLQKAEESHDLGAIYRICEKLV